MEKRLADLWYLCLFRLLQLSLVGVVMPETMRLWTVRDRWDVEWERGKLVVYHNDGKPCWLCKDTQQVWYKHGLGGCPICYDGELPFEPRVAETVMLSEETIRNVTTALASDW